VLPQVTSPQAALTRNDFTGIYVIGTGLTGSDRVRMRNRFPRFLLIIVVHNLPLRMTGRSMDTGCDVIKRHVTPKGFPWKGGVRACATESCAIFALVGPFHRR
jgi:hypothetical protein